jgi:PAS domain S-box-containing protein
MREFLKRVFASRAQTDPPAPRPASAKPARPAGGLPGSEERFRLMIESVKEYAIFMLDPGGRIATWNIGAERLKGYTAQEIIGKHFAVFYPREDVAAGKPARVLETATGTGKFEEEGWRVRKDGSLFWASVVITALRDEHGVLRGFGKVTRDMTERRNAEEETRKRLQEEAARRAAEHSTREALRAQQEERRQREQLRVTLASIGDAVIVTDPAGMVTFMNPVAVDLTGWAPDAAAGQQLERVFRILNEQTRQPVESPVTKVLREGTVVGLANHTILATTDGREIPIDDSGAPIRGEGGTIAGVVLVFRDVTEARRAVEARLHLAAIVESSDDAVISESLDGLIVSWNRGAERIYGYTAEEIVGQPLSLLVPADHPDELPALLERLKRDERIEHFETVRVRKDGTRLDVSLTLSPVKNAEGQVVGASKIARDITAVKRHEASLRFLADASKALAELLDPESTLQKVASLAVPQFADWCVVDLADGDGDLRRVAVAQADPAKVRMAREIHHRYPPRPGDAHGALHVLRTGRSELLADVSDALLVAAAHNDEHLAALRSVGPHSYLGVPLLIRGTAVGVLTFVTAESGRRFGADDLRVAEDLAQRAGIALENARLYADLKTADRQKNEWIAMLAHELRNPLAPIRNALHLMSMPGATAEALAQVRDMTERQVDQLVRLVDDLLDVSRIMRSRIDLRKETVDLASVLASGAETAQPLIDAQGQRLVVSVPPEPLWLEGDPTRLAQVVSNLLTNAAKFSPHSGRIWLTAERLGAEAVVRVRDEGSGISPELLPRIFELFTQGDRTLERSRGGLGIGLTVVRRLVELHGGAVTAHSAGPGLGSEFVVRLSGLLSGPAAPVGEAGARQAAAAQTRRVLVVDDNVDAAESVGMILRLWGHQVRVAHTGPEALEVAAQEPPEVVFLDIGLPGLSGYEVARQLRQQPEARAAVLIALTGYGQPEDRRHSGEAGFDLHLTKPLEPDRLRELLESLERRRP